MRSARNPFSRFPDRWSRLLLSIVLPAVFAASSTWAEDIGGASPCRPKRNDSVTGRPSPPWAAESPRAAGAWLGPGLGYLLDSQGNLRNSFLSTTVTLGDPAQGTGSTTILPGDPELNNRKFDYAWHLSGPLLQLPIGLPTGAWGFCSSAILEAGWVDVDFDFDDLNQPELSTSLGGDGPMLGLWLDVIRPLGRDRRWFVGGGYRIRSLDSVDVGRSPAFDSSSFEVQGDKTSLSHTSQELYARLGVEVGGRRFAPFAGVRARRSELEIHDMLSFRSTDTNLQTSLDSTSRFERDTAAALAGFDARLGGSFFGHVEAAFASDEFSVLFKITHLIGLGKLDLSPPEPPDIDWQASFETLVHDGVSISTLASSVGFKAPVKGGVPLVVDFELPRQGRLRLHIWVENAKRPTTLKFRGTGVRKFDKRTLPRELGEHWQTAQFSLTAYDASGKETDFRLFGIGAGERAVGSTGIYDVTFEPFVIRGAESADWGFWSHHDFERSQIVIYRQEQSGGKRQESLAAAFDGRCQPRRNDQCEGEWDGRLDGGERSAGRYRLAVKAWQERGVDKDWIIEWSKDEVTVE